MRRLILIVMMLLVPGQWTWAAAASYCEHESGNWHFGHHEHQHESSASADTAGPVGSDFGGSDPVAAQHLDCEVCHGVGVALNGAASLLGMALLPAVLMPHGGRFLADPPLEPLLRPPLSLVA